MVDDRDPENAHIVLPVLFVLLGLSSRHSSGAELLIATNTVFLTVLVAVLRH